MSIHSEIGCKTLGFQASVLQRMRWQRSEDLTPSHRLPLTGHLELHPGVAAPNRIRLLILQPCGL